MQDARPSDDQQDLFAAHAGKPQNATTADQCNSGAGTTLRPATLDDWPTIRKWLRLPAVEAWWGPATVTEGAVLAVLQTKQAIARIIIADNREVGYAHAADACIWGEALPDGLRPGTWELDVFIADPSARGRGRGPAAVQQLMLEVFATTLAPAVCVCPPLHNEHAVRAYEKAGFSWATVQPSTHRGPAWFMVANRASGITCRT